jgi:hypothetical protein
MRRQVEKIVYRDRERIVEKPVYVPVEVEKTVYQDREVPVYRDRFVQVVILFFDFRSFNQ